MSDAITEPEAPAEPDTPTEPVTQADTPDPEVDYRKRYEDLRPEYTRATQTLSDEEALIAHIAEKFPHLLAEEEDDDYEDDDEQDESPQIVNDPRVDQLAQWQQEELARRAAEQYDRDFNEIRGDRDIPKQGRDWINGQVLSKDNPTKADLEQAVKEWIEFEDSLKPTPRNRAPHVPAGGNPADPEPPKTHNDRVQRAMERLTAESA